MIQQLVINTKAHLNDHWERTTDPTILVQHIITDFAAVQFQGASPSKPFALIDLKAVDLQPPHSTFTTLCLYEGGIDLPAVKEQDILPDNEDMIAFRLNARPVNHKKSVGQS